jgi:predicted DNA binding CopG/RHH family protein
MSKKQMPQFSSDAEEGRWMREHQDELDEYLNMPTPESRARADKLLASLPPRVARSRNITISVPVNLIDRARRQAERKGIGYQTYLKTLIADGLEREEAARG